MMGSVVVIDTASMVCTRYIPVEATGKMIRSHKVTIDDNGATTNQTIVALNDFRLNPLILERLTS